MAAGYIQTVIEVICCSLFHTQIELPSTCETYNTKPCVVVNDCTFGPGYRAMTFLFCPLTPFSALCTSLCYFKSSFSQYRNLPFFLFSFSLCSLPHLSHHHTSQPSLMRLDFTATSAQPQHTFSFTWWFRLSPLMSPVIPHCLSFGFLHGMVARGLL